MTGGDNPRLEYMMSSIVMVGDVFFLVVLTPQPAPNQAENENS